MEEILRELIELAQQAESEALDESLPKSRRKAAQTLAHAARAHHASALLLELMRERYNLIRARIDPDPNAN